MSFKAFPPSLFLEREREARMHCKIRGMAFSEEINVELGRKKEKRKERKLEITHSMSRERERKKERKGENDERERHTYVP